MDTKVTVLIEKDGEQKKIVCDECYITFQTGDRIGHLWKTSPAQLAELLARDKHIRANWDYMKYDISMSMRMIAEMNGGTVQ